MNTLKMKMDLELLLDDELEVVKGGISEISESSASLCSGCCLLAVGGSTSPTLPEELS